MAAALRVWRPAGNPRRGLRAGAAAWLVLTAAALGAGSQAPSRPAEADDVAALIARLGAADFADRVAAAEELGRIGDERALPELEKLNATQGGWWINGRPPADPRQTSGVFAWAIWKIRSRRLGREAQVAGWFDLLEGRGPAVPAGVDPRTAQHHTDLGRRVALELDRYGDPAIGARLRQTDNRGAATHAVWMEVRAGPIQQCLQIARRETGALRYGAIQCLGRFGEGAGEALDLLAREGHEEAVRVLGAFQDSPLVLQRICWHLVHNPSPKVRSAAAYQLYGQCSRPGVVPALVKALADPEEDNRRHAAELLVQAAQERRTPHRKELETALHVALGHRDEKVRTLAARALKDLNAGEDGPAAASQSAAADVDESLALLEEEAAERLKTGPPQEAIARYEELLRRRPAYEPYQKAVALARAYEAAADAATEPWPADAPYRAVKGRYAYTLASRPTDTGPLADEFELAVYLSGEDFRQWSRVFADGKDPDRKALAVYEHIVRSYPAHEYLVLRAREAVAGLKLSLDNDVRAGVSAYIELFATPVEKVVDSTDPSRNQPLPEAGGKTQAQADFEHFYKDYLRSRVIELCLSLGRVEGLKLLDQVIERCAQTDPPIVELAKAAKTRLLAGP